VIAQHVLDRRALEREQITGRQTQRSGHARRLKRPPRAIPLQRAELHPQPRRVQQPVDELPVSASTRLLTTHRQAA
jgi:hypothetical protein